MGGKEEVVERRGKGGVGKEEGGGREWVEEWENCKCA